MKIPNTISSSESQSWMAAMKLSLGFKIAAFTSVLILLIGGGLFGIAIYVDRVTLHNMYMTEALKEAKRASTLIENDLYKLDTRELHHAIAGVLAGGSVDLIWVLDKDGQILTNGHESTALLNQTAPISFLDSLSMGKAAVIEMDATYHWTGVPVISESNNLLGYVVVAFTQKRFDEHLNTYLKSQILVLGPMLLIGLLLALYFGRRIAKTVRVVTDAAEQLGAGNWDVRIEADSNDEMGALARSINTLAENLSQITVSQDKLEDIIEAKTVELQQHRIHLQDLVDERTQELRESERSLLLHLENTPLGVIAWDTNFKCTQWNPAAEKIFGFTSEEALGGYGPDMLVPKDIHGQIDGIFDALLNQTGGSHNVNENMTKDGRVIVCEWFNTPLKSEAGVPIGVASMVRDITLQKATEIALHDSEEKFRSIVQTTAEGYWLIDPVTKKVLEVNPALCRMLGYTESQVLCMTPLDFVNEDNAKTLKRHTSALSGADHQAYDVVLTKKDGSELHAHFEASVIRNKEGHPWAEFAFVMDITRHVQIEHELRNAIDVADSANQAKSEFLSSMSHELRTPLNGILGFAQLLEYSPSTPLTEMQKDHTDQIIKSGNHLLGLIDQVLELAKIEAGKVSLSLESLPICAVCEESTPLIKTMADKKGITLIQDRGNCEKVHVRADHTRLTQVFLNLLSNAVKYNRDGGSITVATHVTNSGMVHIAVTDTGLGIPEDKQGGIFQPFERLGQEASNIEGTGIGLTVTRELIHLMNGKIGFESEVGKGTTFWFEVPQVHEKALDDQRGQVSKLMAMPNDLDIALGDAERTYVILYVEDNPANLVLMEQIIDIVPNLKLISAPTAELGIEMATSHRPDLTLMDINLPGMSGIEALADLKKQATTCDIPVIAVTAAAMPDQIEMGMQQDFLTYVTKPIQVDSFLKTLREALEHA